jgi:hypothetical protein
MKTQIPLQNMYNKKITNFIYSNHRMILQFGDEFVHLDFFQNTYEEIEMVDCSFNIDQWDGGALQSLGWKSQEILDYKKKKILEEIKKRGFDEYYRIKEKYNLD